MRRSISSCLAVAFTIAMANEAAVHANDWGQWRGPHRDGISAEKGLLHEWPEGGPPLAWQVKDLGTGYSTPAVVGSRIYLLGNDGLENEFVRALNAADGAKIWATRLGKVGNPDQKPPYPGARSTATVDGDRLYVLSSDGDLACLETEGGDVVWQKSVRKEFGGEPGVWAYAESPLVDGDVVVCTPGGSKGTTLGVLQSAGALARSVGPLVGGALYAAFDPRAPYLIGAAGFALAVLVAFARLR